MNARVSGTKIKQFHYHLVQDASRGSDKLFIVYACVSVSIFGKGDACVAPGCSLGPMEQLQCRHSPLYANECVPH